MYVALFTPEGWKYRKGDGTPGAFAYIIHKDQCGVNTDIGGITSCNAIPSTVYISVIHVDYFHHAD